MSGEPQAPVKASPTLGSPPAVELPAAGVLALVRFSEWRGKIPLFLATMCLAALYLPQPAPALLVEFATLLGCLCLCAAFGYTANAYCDRRADLAAGKINALALLDEHSALAVLCGLVALCGAAIALSFGDRPVVLALFASVLLLSALYSLPPVRLKERGISGWVAAALAQRALPAAIVFEALGSWSWPAAAFCLASAMIGLRYIIVHQIIDAAADRRARVRTVATERGTRPLQLVLRRFVGPVEVILLCVALGPLPALHPAVAAILLIYAAYMAVRLRRQDPKARELVSPDSYRFLSNLYHCVMPLTFSLILAVQEPAFASAFLFTLLVWQWRLLRYPAAALRALFVQPRRRGTLP